MRKFSFFPQLLVVFFFMAAGTFSARAQYSYGVTASYAFATDDLAKGADNGFGATFHARYHFDEYIAAGIDAGYMTFGNKKTDSKVSSLIDGDRLSIIPVTAVFQVYFNDDKIKPFFGFDVGWALTNMKLSTGSKSAVIVAPQVGVDCSISEQLFLRISAKDNVLVYNRLAGGSDIISYIGANIGLIYKMH